MSRPPRKTRLVFWSGGVDSTYLIWHTLENTDFEVQAQYVEIQNNVEKTICETKAIEDLVPYFTAKYPDRFKYAGKVMSIDLNPISPLLNLHQLPIWMAASLLTCPSWCKEIAFGFVSGDCANSYTEDIKRIFESFNGFINTEFYVGGNRFPKPVFPINKLDKSVCVHQLMQLGILDKIWTCEKPQKEGEEFKHCWSCPTCKRLRENIGRYGSIYNVFKSRVVSSALKEIEETVYEIDLPSKPGIEILPEHLCEELC